MNTLELQRNRANVEENAPELLCVDGRQTPTAAAEDFVDMATIRRRVALIKNRWSAETVRARALEGARRRVELEGLVANLLHDEVGSDDGGLRVFM